MDTKCELASAILDYLWYGLYGNSDNHSEEIDGQLVYKENAQEIFNNLLDIIDDVLEERTI